jgi:hypothetical protein
VPIVEAIRRLYVKNAFPITRVEKLFNDGYITEDEKRFILTGSYDKEIVEYYGESD